MYRIHPGYLAWVLEALERGEVLNRIAVPEAVATPQSGIGTDARIETHDGGD